MDWNEFLREADAVKDLDLMRQALAQGADPNGAADDDGDRDAPLLRAVSKGHHEAIRLLLDAGATVASERGADQTSLHAAVSDNNLPVVEMLLQADGAATLNWFDWLDRTPLMIAVQEGRLEIARCLIAAGADVNAHNEDQIGNTALREVASNGSLEMVQLLVQAGADPSIPGWMQTTALDEARQRKKPEGRRICELLERAAHGKL